ncbi:MAG: hypothetical protein FWD28_01650 [Treponema sp.]|nr:hypothetical protein [Treponema sp.]
MFSKNIEYENDWEKLFDIGNDFYFKKDFLNAKKFYSKAINILESKDHLSPMLKRNLTNIKHNAISILDDLGDRALAINGMLDLVEENPDYYLAYNSLGWLYKEEARKIDRQINKLSQKGFTNLNTQHEQNNIKSLYKKAIHYYDLSISTERPYWLHTSYGSKGYCLSEIKQYEKSLECYITADKLKRFNHDYVYSIGLMYFKLLNYNSALHYIREATKIRYKKIYSDNMVSFFSPPQADDFFNAYKNLFITGYNPSYLGNIFKEDSIIFPSRNDRVCLSPISNIFKGKTYLKESKKRIEKIGERYKLIFEYDDHAEVLKRLSECYKNNNFFKIVKKLSLISSDDFKIVTVILLLDGDFASCDLAAIIKNRIYISFSGITIVNNSGKDLFILIAKHLIKMGIRVWDVGSTSFGDPFLKYKLDHGFEQVTTEKYLEIFNCAVSCTEYKGVSDGQRNESFF